MTPETAVVAIVAIVGAVVLAVIGVLARSRVARVLAGVPTESAPAPPPIVREGVTMVIGWTTEGHTRLLQVADELDISPTQVIGHAFETYDALVTRGRVTKTGDGTQRINLGIADDDEETDTEEVVKVTAWDRIREEDA